MSDNDRELYEQLERDWRDALCKKDMERLRALIHPKFVLIGSKSTGPFTMTRDEWLEAIQHRDVDSIEVDVRSAILLDQVLIGTVQARWKIKYMTRLIEDCVLMTDVWTLDDGRWQVIRRHSTPAPAPTAANEG